MYNQTYKVEETTYLQDINVLFKKKQEETTDTKIDFKIVIEKENQPNEILDLLVLEEQVFIGICKVFRKIRPSTFKESRIKE